MHDYQKKKIFLLLLSVAFIFLTSCAKKGIVVLPVVSDYEAPPVAESKALKLGVVPGPYGDIFMDSIEPFFAEKGYSVELVYYDDYIQPNIALANNEIDMNMFQHNRYLNSFKFEYDLALSSITEIPTAPMGIFSLRYASLKALNDYLTISIPSDSTNMSRALRILESSGLLVINPYVDKNKATLQDLVANPHNLRIVLKEAHDLVESLEECDLSVINGNYALSHGLKLTDALYRETLTDGYVNVIAVRTEDLGSRFVADIIDIIYSEPYKKLILQNELCKGFHFPRNFFDTGDWREKIS